jgi:hypothetical protein
MSRLTRRTAGWLAGAAAGLAVALPVALIPGHVDTTSEPAGLGPGGRGPGDYIRQIAARLRVDHVYVAPEAHAPISDSEIAQLRRTAVAGEVPVYLAWLPDRDRAGSPGWRNTYDALDQLEASVGRKGYYVVMDRQTLPITGAVGYRDPYADADLLLGRAGKALNAYVTALSQDPPEAPYDDQPDDEGYWGGTASATTAGLLFGVGGFLALLAIVALAGLGWRRLR